MTKMAFFTHNLGYGGAERVIVNLANEFVKREISVDIIIHESVGPLRNQLNEEVNVIYTETPSILPTIQRLRHYIKSTAPDTLLSTVNIANLAAILAVKTTKTDTRHIVRVANTPSRKVQEYQGAGLKLRIVPYLMRGLYPRADRLLAVSEGLKKDIISFYGIDSSKIEVIYNPTITDEVFDLAEEPVNHPWLNGSDFPVIIGVGSLRFQKDFSTAIRGFATFKQEHYSSARFLILGEGEQRTELESLADELGVSDYVDLPGTVENPYAYLSKSDLFVLSSRWEGCPNVLVEAMACGTPVVATDCPHGPSEILCNGKFGHLVAPQDEIGLTQALANELAFNRDSDELKARAQDFSVSSLAGEYEQMLFFED